MRNRNIMKTLWSNPRKSKGIDDGDTKVTFDI